MTDATDLTAFDQSAAFRNHPLIASAHAPGENRNTFEAFVRGVIGDLHPVGAIEATLAARVAGLAWRLNRAQQLETRFLSKGNAGATPLEAALTSYKQGEHIDAISRWEQGLERSLYKTLDALNDMQRRRRQREKSGNPVETAQEKSTLLANERQVPRNEIEFDGEKTVFQNDRESASTP